MPQEYYTTNTALTQVLSQTES